MISGTHRIRYSSDQALLKCKSGAISLILELELIPYYSPLDSHFSSDICCYIQSKGSVLITLGFLQWEFHSHVVIQAF